MSIEIIEVEQPQIALPEVDIAFVEQAVARVGRAPEAVIPILQAIQEHYHWLPPKALRRVTELTEITPAQIAGVSTFYSQFRHRPAGKYIIRVCHGTACHVKGSELIDDAIRRHLEILPHQDTDAEGTFTIERVGCIGCCTLAPVMQVGQVTYGHRSPENTPLALTDFLEHDTAGTPHEHHGRPVRKDGVVPEIRIGCGSCCVAGGAGAVQHALEDAVRRSGLDVMVKPVGCSGMCHQTPLIEIKGNGKPLSMYAKVAPEQVDAIVKRHFRPRGAWRRVRNALADAIDNLLGADEPQDAQRHALDARDGPVCDFLGAQLRIATETGGELDPLDVDEYVAHGGFAAASKAIGELTPDAIIDELKKSGLRGRGGAGFPTGEKWLRVRTSRGEVKYLICNGDEGDPGAFMDRMILESFPYRVLEGMIIAARAIGSSQAILYIRHEYPLAVRRIREAIKRCEERGFLGDRIFGSDQALHMRVVEGAGAFICGEETAMIASIEGQRGMPRLKPPYPSEVGLWGKPTCINNVETYALVPWIIRNGAQSFANIGTEKSKGTKVFALTGKIRRGGLIEVPMGISIRQIVEDIGGGVGPGRTFKAVQIGGPSGGCIPAELADLPVDYESLSKAGAIMGSGGLVVLDDRDCMVDIARYFLNFTQAESCGQCSFCRIGTKVLLDILTRLCEGKGKPSDLEKLDELCLQVKQGSLCGLGQTAPNPVITTLRYFRDEYEAHVHGRCPAGKCKGLIRYEVTDECFGCTKCAQQCPADAIPMAPYAKHAINDAKCTRCDICRTACPVAAIKIVTGPDKHEGTKSTKEVHA